MEQAGLVIADVVDEGSFVPADDPALDRDPLGYPGYREALNDSRAGSRADESVTTGAATIGGHAAELAFFNFSFLGGSMGEVAGERLARAMERAIDGGVPFVLVTATGGARMQEGMRSLIQMPKVVAARIALGEAHRPFVALLSHPTTGGVLASVGASADYTLALQGATVGFAGPRVVESQTERPLRAGSHTADSALDSGLVDRVVAAGGARTATADALAVLGPDEGGSAAESLEVVTGRAVAEPVDAWNAVRAARAEDRPLAPDLARAVIEPYVELRGDRAGRDDPAVAALLGRVRGRRALVLALDRRHPPGPHGYRKALRALAVAARLRIPVATLVDTPGADAREDSEAGGIAWAIAALFEAVMTAPVPVVAIVTGEGGSGGALAFACGDRLIAFEDSIFSVIAPELAAEILWRDADRAPDAARRLRLTAQDLLDLGIADALVPGPPTPQSVESLLAYHLARPAGGPEARRRRWRGLG